MPFKRKTYYDEMEEMRLSHRTISTCYKVQICFVPSIFGNGKRAIIFKTSFIDEILIFNE